MRLKELAVGVAATAMLGAGFVSSAQQVSAAAWHKGSPKLFIGTWKSDGYPLYKFTANKITVYGKGGGTSKAMYKYLGHKKYTVKYKVQGYHYKETFTYVNSHKLKGHGFNLTR